MHRTAATHMWTDRRRYADVSETQSLTPALTLTASTHLPGAELCMKYDAWASVKGAGKDDAMRSNS